MKKFILILFCSTQVLLPPLLPSDQFITLPNKDKVYPILCTYVVSWSSITLNEVAQEIAGKNYSFKSLESYLTKRMFNDSQIQCLELTLAAQKIIEKSSCLTN